MQVRDAMTREVVTVGPDTPATYAAEVMAGHGYAALPVVDDDGAVIGIVAEADLLRDRLPAAPGPHGDGDDDTRTAPLLVRGAMTGGVRTVDAGADVSDVARLFVDDALRSVPVLEHGQLAGIVSRRDLLRALVRTDDVIRRDVLRLVEDYTGDRGAWEVTVVEGVAAVRRTAGFPDPSPAEEERSLRALARTVPGVVGVRVLPGGPGGPGGSREGVLDSGSVS